MDAIKTIDLTKKYKDVTAVDGLNLTVREPPKGAQAKASAASHNAVCSARGLQASPLLQHRMPLLQARFLYPSAKPFPDRLRKSRVKVRAPL